MNICKWCGCAVSNGLGPPSQPEWKRWRCQECGVFGYVDEPSQQELSEVYESAWEAADATGRFATGSTDDKIANSLLKAVGYASKDSNTVCLDYGGGSGQFAEVLLEQGADLTVYEPYGDNPGFQEKVCWLSDVKDIPENSFDWIFMVEVIEHLLDPQEELANIYRYLAPRGKLVVTTPNAKGWRARLDGFNWREVQNPTHINLFTAPTLKGVLQKTGFSNIKRIYKPVTFHQTGIKSIVLSATQILGIDGGLRFVVER